MFFAGATFLFWVHSAENLRFLIPCWMAVSIAVADRCFCFYERSGRVAKAAMLAAAGYCGIFALAVGGILMVNAPRLEYVARRLDREQYLSQSLAVYPALAWLNRTARSGERIYAVSKTCPRLYSNPPLVCYLIPA